MNYRGNGMNIYEKLYCLIDNREVSNVYGILIDYHDHQELIHICKESEYCVPSAIGSLSKTCNSEFLDINKYFNYANNTFLGFKLIVARNIEEPRLIL